MKTLLFVAFVAFFAHPVHLTTTEVVHNEKTKMLEVTLQIFVDDLETALSKRTGTEIRFKDDLNDTLHNQLIETYINANFDIRLDDIGVPYKMIGKEGKDHDIWVFMEAKAPEAYRQIEFRNGLFMELFADQKNIMHWTRGTVKTSVACTSEQVINTIQFN